MTHVQPANGGADPGSSLNVVAKSSVWQGFLSSASVIATSLLLEVISKLLESWVGESRVLNSVSYWLSRIAVLVVVLAAGYVLWRRLATVRERMRRERELRLTADLVPPGPAVRPSPDLAGGCASESGTARRDPALNGNIVAAVLRELPFDRYEAAALYDMVSAMLVVWRRVPAARAVEDDRSATAVIADLVAHRALVHGEHDRLVRTAVPDSPSRAEVLAGLEWETALPSLLRHHADRATRWAAALDYARLAPGARRWFEQEQDHLRELVRRTAAHANAFGPQSPPGPAPRPVLDAAIPELTRIVDALDLWSVRDGSESANHEVLQAISTLTPRSRYPLEYELARIRTGNPTRTSRISWLHPYKAALSARADSHRALALLESAAAETASVDTSTAQETGATSPAVAVEPQTPARAQAVVEAVQLLERAWERLPRKDIAGEVGALIDLGVVLLREGRLDAARDRLDAARVAAEAGRDPAGVAHAVETLGVLWWARGQRRRALRSWQRGLGRYRELDHRLGVARCLQHLGSAMVIAPEYGGLVLPGSPTTEEVVRQASGWLAECERLRRHVLDHRDIECLATRYRDRAAEFLSEELPTVIDHWPLPEPAEAHT
ncbi:hypothetical protein [Nocardia pseudobrasiliensis]|uniref:Tetratricopeptide repeat protein n=1 Tax=Nocardia pseudobrasiliensis TaxID=45979 RepID=A0A370HYW5_9NOCA|nr:hypothetical protein [Nocardia pseudobrasiliensis]RDI63659.1 hypothetical protein DFR76_110356 [Nocardia pseudobrasiliensis]